MGGPLAPQHGLHRRPTFLSVITQLDRAIRIVAAAPAPAIVAYDPGLSVGQESRTTGMSPKRANAEPRRAAAWCHQATSAPYGRGTLDGLRDRARSRTKWSMCAFTTVLLSLQRFQPERTA